MFRADYLPYSDTHAFSKIVLDYLSQSPALQPFYEHPPTLDGIRQSIKAKAKFKTNREVLVEVLTDQYKAYPDQPAVTANIQTLLSSNCYTVTTAHQPNLLTGPLYFLYKIVHAIKLTQHLTEKFPEQKFVPVFYMGSEDADLDELNNINVDGKKYVWRTKQKGAVGRMLVDEALIQLMAELQRQITVLPFGAQWMQLLQKHYTKGRAIQWATAGLLHELFGEHGLVVLVADDSRLKKLMLPVFEDELLHPRSGSIVAKTAKNLQQHYKVQAHPRDINLFYLKEDIRERIEQTPEGYVVVNTNLKFSQPELLQRLKEHPELFSPNVILRGLYQETILPNIAFIGGGGELAYWLQLKDLFVHYNVPFPVLLLRNSYAVLTSKAHDQFTSLGLSYAQIMQPENKLMQEWVTKHAHTTLKLNGSLEEAERLYNDVHEKAVAVDPTLQQHVAALKQKTLYRLKAVEQKMLRAEKRRQAATLQRLTNLRNILRPGGGLQERTENTALFFGMWGNSFLDALLQHAPALEAHFTFLHPTN